MMKACISTLIGICVLFNAGSSHAQCPSNKRQLDVAVTQGFVTESQAFKSINNNPDEQQKDWPVVSQKKTTALRSRGILP